MHRFSIKLGNDMKKSIATKLKHLVSAGALLAVSSMAHADVVYTFTSTQVAAFGAAPYGTVTLNDIGTGVTFKVQLRPDLNFVNTGGPHSIFSFNALGVLSSDISNILFNGIADPNVTVLSPGANQPFGTSFSLMLDCTGAGCANGAPGAHFDPLTFTVANAEYSDFGFMASGTTAFFAADVICVTGQCNGATGAIGVVGGGGGGGGGTGTPIPEPLSVSLMALGLLGVATTRRLRR